MVCQSLQLASKSEAISFPAWRHCGPASSSSPACRQVHCTQRLVKSTRLPSSFTGATLRLSKTPTQSPPCKLAPPRAAAAPAVPPGGQASPTPPHLEEHVLDGISTWICQKVKEVKGTDHLAILPHPIHRALHHLEPLAGVLVRESLITALAVVFILSASHICQSLNWFWGTVFRCDSEIEEEEFRSSGFWALIGPLKLFTLAVLLTRYLRLVAPVFRVHLKHHLVFRLRAVALVGCLTSFMLSWKNLALTNFLSSTNLTQQRVKMIDRGASLLLLTIGIFTAAEAWGLPLRSVFALGGISGLAVGLASREVVTNFFGGLVLVVTHPFAIGDSIKTGMFSGRVEDIGYFQTRIVGFDKCPITVPNQVFTNMVITNFSRAMHRRLSAKFWVRHQDILLVDEITRKLTEYLRAHPAIDTKEEAPGAHLQAVGNASLEISISAVAKCGVAFTAVQQEIFVEAANIIIACGACLGANRPFIPIYPKAQLPELEDSGAAALPAAAAVDA